MLQILLTNPSDQNPTCPLLNTSSSPSAAQEPKVSLSSKVLPIPMPPPMPTPPTNTQLQLSPQTANIPSE